MTTIELFNIDCHGSKKDVLFIKRLREFFDDDEIEEILEIITDTCRWCWNNDSNCYCMCDD